jgi:hypothetical protein
MARFRFFGKWTTVIVALLFIWGMIVPAADVSPFYSKQQTIINRILFCSPFLYSLYYMFSKSYSQLYTNKNNVNKPENNEA